MAALSEPLKSLSVRWENPNLWTFLAFTLKRCSREIAGNSRGGDVMPDWTGTTAVSGLTVITLILVLSFAIDRIVAASLFLLSFSAAWNRRFPEPTLMESPGELFDAEKRRKLIYFLLA